MNTSNETCFFLREDIVRNVLIIYEAPGDEGQVLPLVDLGAGRHVVPVRAVSSRRDEMTDQLLVAVFTSVWGTS